QNIDGITYELRLRLYNPYRGDGLNNTNGGLSTSDRGVDWTVWFGDDSKIVSDAHKLQAGEKPILQGMEQDADDETKKFEVRLVRLASDNTPIVIDRISGAALDALLAPPAYTDLINDEVTNRVARKIWAAEYNRGTAVQTVVCIGGFESVAELPADVDIGNEMPGGQWPVLIPNCVADVARNRETEAEPLPMNPPGDGTSYRAFPRLGDLNQVLTVDNTGASPWTLSLTSSADERDAKFNWLVNADASLFLS
ncbi:unnamed protein product, partial [marine sediment metagenome]